jgi:hypothetical protein
MGMLRLYTHVFAVAHLDPALRLALREIVDLGVINVG